MKRTLVLLLVGIALTVSGNSIARAQEFVSPEDTVAFAWSPDGTHYAMGRGNGLVALFDSAGVLVHGFSVAPGPANFVQWDDSGTRLAAAGDAVIIIYTLATRDRIMLDFIRIETVGRALAAFDFSPDGGRVIYALNTPFPVRSAEIFSLSDSTLERRLRATDDINDITALAWNPDGTRIAIASHIADTDALVFVDIATRARQMAAASTRIDTLSWSPDGARIAGGSRDLTIWDAATGDVLNDPVAAAQGALRSVAWNADSTQFVAGYDDGTVAVFDAETGESLAVYTTGAAGPAPASWNWADDTIGYPDASGNLIVQPAPQPVEAAGNA